jgi:hypothetical protein
MKPEYDCPMLKKWSITLAFIVLGAVAYSQSNTPADTTIAPGKNELGIDTSLDYDELFRDFDAFMDSILTPPSYFLGSLSVSKGYFNFERKASGSVQTSKRITYSPAIGYYSKGGLGITATGYLVHDLTNLNLYQFSLTPSFDYLKNRDFATGFSYTRYFTKDSLPFYTSPLQNEIYGYFTWRKPWLRPNFAVSYGWGSRSDYQQREDLITSLRLRPRGFTYINTTESVRDFSLMASLRHDFYWLDVFTYNDYIRFTPQVAFTSGTQKFGFNQTSNTYGTTLRNAVNVLYSTENVYLDDQVNFQPISLTLFLRGEYSIGKFFIQPQFTVDYYFPATTRNLSSLLSLTTGFMF